MENNFSWRGSSDPEVQSGVAAFGDREVRLESFRDFQFVVGLIDKAKKDGYCDGKLAVETVVKNFVRSSV